MQSGSISTHSVNSTHGPNANVSRRCNSLESVGQSSQTVLYTEGQNRELDKKYKAYSKMNIWRGPAVSGALRRDEADTLVDLWKKEKICP